MLFVLSAVWITYWCMPCFHLSYHRSLVGIDRHIQSLIPDVGKRRWLRSHVDRVCTLQGGLHWPLVLQTQQKQLDQFRVPVKVVQALYRSLACNRLKGTALQRSSCSDLSHQIAWWRPQRQYHWLIEPPAWFVTLPAYCWQNDFASRNPGFSTARNKRDTQTKLTFSVVGEYAKESQESVSYKVGEVASFIRLCCHACFRKLENHEIIVS